MKAWWRKIKSQIVQDDPYEAAERLSHEQLAAQMKCLNVEVWEPLAFVSDTNGRN